MATKVFKNLEEFRAARENRPVAARGSDPLDRLYGALGWWWTGELQEFEENPGKVLPITMKVADEPEARRAAARGWRPIEDRDVPDEVIGLLVAFHGGADHLPAALARQLADRVSKPATAAAAAAAKK